MYQPPHHREDRLEVQHALIRAFPLGTLVTHGAVRPDANHVPFLIDPERSTLGTLRAHVARANPLWRELDPAQEALVIFQGAERYITPSWYETKRETGKVVPTWNYAVVHAYGRAAGHRGRGLAARADRRPHALQRGGRAEPWAVRTRPSSSSTRMLQRHRRHRDRDRPDRGQVEGEPEPPRGRPPRASSRACAPRRTGGAARWPPRRGVRRQAIGLSSRPAWGRRR